MAATEIDHAIVAAARDSYSQLVAFLTARAGGDFSAAEDALGEAFLAAMKQWPAEGIPAKPEAWLITTARRRLVDSQRRGETRSRREGQLLVALEDAQELADSEADFPDERLRLLFVCTHPAIDPSARAPLSLQSVLGLDAARIASAFLVSPAAMSQRLVRAKSKIRAAGIPFHVPGPEEWPERLEFVLDAIYVAFNSGWETMLDPDSPDGGLAEEAIWLGRLLVRLTPEEPEPLGLLALMLHCHARRQARRGKDGGFIPLLRQETRLWSKPMMNEADDLIRQAATRRTPGRFQLEAAIQSVHAARAVTGLIDWPMIVRFYETLMTLTPAIGARIGHALCRSEIHGAEDGLRCLDSVNGSLISEHQPYWVARAHLLKSAGRLEESSEAYRKAIGLTEDPAVRAFLISENS
jgi:RNA polymerase sigma-70 factor, ECF subfamily